MVTQALDDPKVIVDGYLHELRVYATRVFCLGAELEADEVEDRQRRLAELMAIGDALGLTKKELVTLVYRGVFEQRGRCGCPTCRARSAGV